MALFSCAGKRPTNLGVVASRLTPCPGSPNCVSSDASDRGHAIEPLALAAPADQAWRGVREVLTALPRTRLIRDEPGYLHAECTSALLGFVDDLELQLRADEGLIAVRSASRVGYSDMGVNRRRVEDLRQRLRSKGLIR